MRNLLDLAMVASLTVRRNSGPRISIIARFAVLVLIALLSLGQMLAFAPIGVAPTASVLTPTAPMAAVMRHAGPDADMQGAGHHKDPTHHLAGAHCLGCALPSAEYPLRARPIAHPYIVAMLPGLARFVRITPFRPPIPTST